MLRTVVEPSHFIVRKALTGGKYIFATLAHVLFAKAFCFFAVVTFLLVFTASWAIASPTPQVRQIYVKNDGTYLQWKAVYDVNFNWDFNSDPNLDQNRGPTLEIFGLQGLPAGQGLQTRVWLFPQDDPSTVVFSVDLQSQIQYEGQAIVSGNETIGYISLSTLANAGFSLPSDISKLSFGNYNLYCGNGQICAETIYYSASAFLPLSVLDNNWRLILSLDDGNLAAPQEFNISPNMPATHGTTITVSFAPVENATGYELCVGTQPGDYSLGYVPVQPNDQFTMQDGWDYYVAVRAISGQVKGAPSAAVRVYSVESAPSIYLTSDENEYSSGDTMNLFVASSPSTTNNEAKYNLRFALYPINNPQAAVYFNGDSFQRSETYWVTNFTLPEISDWATLPIVFHLSGAPLPDQRFVFDLTLEDLEGNPVANATYNFRYKDNSFSTMTSAQQLPSVKPSKNSPMQTKAMMSSSQTNRNFAIDKLATLGKAAGYSASWAYNFIQQAKPLYDKAQLVSEVIEMKDDFEGWQEDPDVSDYADNLLAIRIMLKVLEHDDIMGATVPSKNLMYGAKQYFKAMASSARALSAIDGDTQLGVSVDDDCWLKTCWSGIGTKVKLTMQPIDICQDSASGHDFEFSTCVKYAKDPATVLANTVHGSREVEIDTVSNFTWISGLKIGWYLLEARRVDNNKVVHRQTVFVDRWNDEETIKITDKALKNTKY